MNVTMLREVQKSIANPYNEFCWGNWGCCIGGHAVSIATGRPIQPILEVNPSNADFPEVAQTVLDLDIYQANYLFYGYSNDSRSDRELAIEFIDMVISGDYPKHFSKTLPWYQPAGVEEKEEELVAA